MKTLEMVKPRAARVSRWLRSRTLPILDSTLALMLEGYPYLSSQRARTHSDAFQRRILLRKTVCMVGPSAAAIFYDPERFVRAGAAPRRMVKTLLGKGGVQSLDGAAHAHRKQMLMSLMTPESMGALSVLFADEWRKALATWESRSEVRLFDELEGMLCRAVCAWAGVPLPPAEASLRTRQLSTIIDATGGAGPRHWRGRVLRKRVDAWLGKVVEDARAGRIEVRPQSPLHVIATHRDADGSPLSTHTAAVELCNLLRPTVAIARFVTFAALALEEHEAARKAVRSGSDEHLRWFVQEVRRFYPFFPVASARVRKDFTWRDCRFKAGQRALLDLYGTNHDARSWVAPHEFRPQRFGEWRESAFDFVPQGGGDAFTGHRCAGEWLTIELMKVSTRMLTREMQYEVAPQDLSVSLRRMPTLPRSRFVISQVRRAPATTSQA